MATTECKSCNGTGSIEDKMITNTLEVAVTKTYLVSVRHDEEFDTEEFIRENLGGITSNANYFPQIDEEISLEQVTGQSLKNKTIDVAEFEKWKEKKDLYNAVLY